MNPETDSAQSSKWTPCSLGDVADWLSGGTPYKSNPTYWNGSIPWVSPKDMKVFALADTEDHVTESGLRAGSRAVPAGSVMIVVRGMILAHTFPVCLTSRTMAFNQDVKALVPKSGTDGGYLAHWLVGKSNKMLGLVTESTHGTKRIDLRDIQAYKLALPLRDEQCRIAAVIDTIDDAIRKTEQIIAKLQQMKQGLLHDVLTLGIDKNGELRDPERHPEQFKDSPLGRIPVGWDVLDFGSRCSSSAFGPRFPGDLYAEDGNLATLRTTDMDDDGNVDLTTMPLARIPIASMQRHLLEPDDLVISRSGTCGVAAVFVGYQKPVVPGAFLIRFRLRARATSQYFRRYFNSSLGRPRLERLAVGGVQKNLTGSAILALEVPVPLEAEMKAIATVIEDAEARLWSEKRELDKLRAIKRGLMGDLLTGNVLVPAASEAAP